MAAWQRGWAPSAPVNTPGTARGCCCPRPGAAALGTCPRLPAGARRWTERGEGAQRAARLQASPPRAPSLGGTKSCVRTARGGGARGPVPGAERQISSTVLSSAIMPNITSATIWARARISRGFHFHKQEGIMQSAMGWV